MLICIQCFARRVFRTEICVELPSANQDGDGTRFFSPYGTMICHDFFPRESGISTFQSTFRYAIFFLFHYGGRYFKCITLPFEQVDHLGVQIDSEKTRVYVADSKVALVQEMAGNLIRQSHQDIRIIPSDTIRRFCEVCVSISLALPLAPFYTRSLYFDVS